MRRAAAMMCPKCACLIESATKYELNKNGIWLKDGQTIDRNDKREGTGIRSDIASFWLKGPAAAFASWKDLVSRYVLAEQKWQRTGSQEALKSTVSTDQGEPFFPAAPSATACRTSLKETALPTGREVPARRALPRRHRGRAEEHVGSAGSSASAPPRDGPFKAVVIDRFDIRKSSARTTTATPCGEAGVIPRTGTC